MRYDAFGNRTTTNSADPYDPTDYQWDGAFGYQTEYASYTEVGIGLRYLGQRYYDPAVGRFLSPDPIGFGGGLTLYAYCGNDPVNCADPSGLAGDAEPEPEREPLPGPRAGRVADPEDILPARLWAAWDAEDRAEQERLGREVERNFREMLGRNGIDPAVFEAEEIAALGRLMAGGDHPMPPMVPCSALGGGLLPAWMVGEGEEAAPVAGPRRGGENPAAAIGRARHDELFEKARAKGRAVEPRYPDPETGREIKPDLVTPRGRPIEYKPRTPSGIAKGRSQIRRYERVLQRRGRVLYYDPEGSAE